MKKKCPRCGRTRGKRGKTQGATDKPVICQRCAVRVR